jgi:hypothetical protein
MSANLTPSSSNTARQARKEASMGETIARIGPESRVELIDDKSKVIEAVTPMTAKDAAFLALSILASAAALSAPNAPKVGALVSDAHLPIMQWKLGRSNVTGNPVLILTIPSGIELTFEMPPKGAREMGAALTSRGDGTAPPEGHSGTIH